MTSLRAAWLDYREAVRAFSRPARLYLLTELLAWTGHGVFQVLYNLYLVAGGFSEVFVGQAISANALGLALTALPAGLLAERWGRLRCLLLGALLDGAGMVLRSTILDPGIILSGSFVAGAGQALLAIAAAPFLTEHSSPRERTHLFSAFFATALAAGVIGSVLGGWIPWVLQRLPEAMRPDPLLGYRLALLTGACLGLTAMLPLLRLSGLEETKYSPAEAPTGRETVQKLAPIAVNAILIGAGAGLVIPFMNLYFAVRFGCSSGQIGLFFAIAQISTAAAGLIGPVLARRFGKLKTATAFELLSLPFLITLGAERRLSVAVGAFWLRATLMQASNPLFQAFVMETLAPALRARASSLINLLWNAGWAVSATLAGAIIQRFGYAVPFYITAVLYGAAATFFYWSFRGTPETGSEIKLSEEAKGQRGEGALTE
jgi:MFS family permease